MSKQRPDAAKLSNELAGASAFFRPTARPAAPEPEPPDVNAPAPTTPEPAANPDVVTSRRHSVTTSPATGATAGFDLNRPTASRDSLRLSIDETKALDELRQSLKWDYDLAVSKNDICRAALHLLLEDWTAKGERSAAVSRLKRKQLR
jgi:hypothetical protein